MFPTLTSRAFLLWKNAAGRALSALSSPPAEKRFLARAGSFFSASFRFGGTMSRSSTSTPAFAK